MKKRSPEELRRAKRALYEDLAAGRLTIAEAVREMRLTTGMTQAEFAEKVAGISTRALAQIERGRGNPTLETLRAIGRAFGLDVGFVRHGTRNREWASARSRSGE